MKIIYFDACKPSCNIATAFMKIFYLFSAPYSLSFFLSFMQQDGARNYNKQHTRSWNSIDIVPTLCHHWLGDGVLVNFQPAKTKRRVGVLEFNKTLIAHEK